MAETRSGTRPVAEMDLHRVRFGALEFTTGGRAGAHALLQEWRDASEPAGKMIGFVNPHVYNGAAAAPEAQVRAEIRRYLVLPGQATSYKIGMLKILS